MQVEWLERALKNLEDDASYIALENPKAADDFSDAIFASVNKLAQFPTMGREGRVKNTREWAVPNWSYLIPIGYAAIVFKSSGYSTQATASYQVVTGAQPICGKSHGPLGIGRRPDIELTEQSARLIIGVCPVVPGQNKTGIARGESSGRFSLPSCSLARKMSPTTLRLKPKRLEPLKIVEWVTGSPPRYQLGKFRLPI
jgi:plasmid stabilization system protein ParE